MCLLVACTDTDYDLKKLDGSITLFGEGVSVPLGNTAKFRLADIIDTDDAEGLAIDSNGAYFWNFSKSTTFNGYFKDLGDIFQFKARTVDVSLFPVSRSKEFDIVLPEASIISFTVSPADAPRTVKDSDYIQARLYLAFPDGYNTALNRIL